MKKQLKYYISLFVIVVAGLTSCEFLELDPTNEFERDDYYKDRNQADMALAGVYSKLAELYKEHMSIWLSAGTDEFLHNKLASSTRGSEISKFNYNAFNTDIKRIWTMSFTLISRTNDLIYNLEGRDTIAYMTLEQRQAMIGEALTLRAFSYLNLVRMFEYVPVRTLPFVDIAEDNGDLHLKSQEPQVVYNQIIEDLSAATGMLPDEPYAFGRVSKSVAHGLLARAYLHLAGVRVNGGVVGVEECYSQVVKHCNAVIESGRHSLLDDYSEVFLNQIQEVQDNREIMWEVVFKFTTERDLGGFIGNYNGPKVGGEVNDDPEGNPLVYITATLNQLYGAEYEETPGLNPDERHGWNSIPYNINFKDGAYSFPGDISNKLRWYGGKWRRVQKVVSGTNASGDDVYTARVLESGAINKWRTSINYPLLRYADVLLMKAEAVNQLYGPTLDAIDNINAVRLRAGAATVQELLASEGLALTQEQLFEVIKDERSRELCFEGLRRFDLVRWGTLVEAMKEQNTLIVNHPDYDPAKDEFLTYPGNAVEERHNVFPIPNDEITLNKNVQQHPLWK
ncbi:RagB/SusD family nutrient uptake outer membrane protein [Carboxylicivirga mesophila]|uniref:RagB/SusD family nutrient uptake outer membrane protein n=1 Tax=Carboxylicivirga mesophila TaxID=1166478 RepID=A0ABS5K5T4_9BACT|nr:RagB/SusD family nutrient uptake outer membrane protein [Carboxylicivirga mesophila]MBS2210272.1 RagB/SusD family nutrient uptake outer membrane protein [Carboxylicivirga mesophila]